MTRRKARRLRMRANRERRDRIVGHGDSLVWTAGLGNASVEAQVTYTRSGVRSVVWRKVRNG